MGYNAYKSLYSEETSDLSKLKTAADNELYQCQRIKFPLERQKTLWEMKEVVVIRVKG